MNGSGECGDKRVRFATQQTGIFFGLLSPLGERIKERGLDLRYPPSPTLPPKGWRGSKIAAELA